MNRRWIAHVLLIAGVTVSGACDRATTGPDHNGGGVTFNADGVGFSAQGAPATDGDLLDSEFATATADSVGGLALVSFDPTSSGVGNLFVLQAPRTPGTYDCRDLTGPCGARYITGVTNNSTVTFDRYFAAVDGQVTFTQVGPERLIGTFRLTLQATDDEADGAIVVENGTIDVPYSDQQVTNGSLVCLLQLSGAGSGNCHT